MEINNANLIFEKWTASLKSRPRSTKNGDAANNFDELFRDLKSADTSFKDAHDILEKAIKAHLPNTHVRKYTWNNYKKVGPLSEKEFYQEWDDQIKSIGTEAFFANYPLKANDDDDGEPKVYGNMSVKEYRLQRKYADSFPTLNTDKLEEELNRRGNFSEDLESALGDKDER